MCTITICCARTRVQSDATPENRSRRAIATSKRVSGWGRGGDSWLQPRTRTRGAKAERENQRQREKPKAERENQRQREKPKAERETKGRERRRTTRVETKDSAVVVPPTSALPHRWWQTSSPSRRAPHSLASAPVLRQWTLRCASCHCWLELGRLASTRASRQSQRERARASPSRPPRPRAQLPARSPHARFAFA